MVEALTNNLPRRLGRYDVVGPVAMRRSPLRSNVFIATARSASAAPPPPDLGTGLALSYSPLGPNEGTTTFQKPVAIKVISPALVADPAQLARFLDAARAVTEVRHDNVAHVHEVGQVGTDVFLVMDYLMGETAATLMRQLHSRGDRLDVKLAAHIIAEASAGLEAAHALGVLHAQLTPHDLFIGYDGSVHVLDIGIARARQKLLPENAEGASFGLEYGSPERCKNEALDRQSDVFSLGSMLWELITGMSPFERAREADMKRAICEEPIVAPRNVVPGLPEQVSTITTKALERDKAKRYATAVALRQALLAFRRQQASAGSATLELGMLMKGLFETRIRDKHEMLRRVESGAGIADLDVREPDEVGAPAEVGAAVEVGATAEDANDAPPSAAAIAAAAALSAAREPEPAHVQVLPLVDAAASGGVEAAATHEIPIALASLPPPPQRPSRLVPLVTLAIGALLALGGTILVIVMQRTPNERPPPTTATSAASSTSSSAPPLVVATGVPTNDVPTAPANSAPVTADFADEAVLHIDTVPSHAAIFVGGAKKGVSPLDLRVPRGSDAITVEIKHAGYHSLKERVVPDVNQRLKLTLVAAQGAAAAPAGSVPYHKFE